MTTTASPVTHALSPDLVKVREFIVEQVAAGNVQFAADAVVHLVARMRDINHDLIRRDMARRRAKPPSETSRRLQQELLLPLDPANENDVASAPSPADGAAELPSSESRSAAIDGDGDGGAATGASSPADAPAEASTGSDGSPSASSAATALAAAAGLLTPKKRGPKQRHQHGRGKLPAHLERVTHEHLVSAPERTCPNCHLEVQRIALQASEVLEISPARFIVRRDLVERCSCPGCRAYVVNADRPDRVVERGLLGPDLLVEALVEHYGEAVSYERMERRAEEQGVPLRANTLARNVSRLVELYDPIVDEIARRVGQSADVGLDATSARVLDPTHPLGIRLASLWLLTGDHTYALFRYASKADAEALMEAFKDIVFANMRLTCDASPTMNCIERKGAIRAGCNAHGRRGLVAALRGGDLRAAEGVALYGTLFHIEAESKRAGESYTQRYERRRRESVPAAADLRAWLDRQRLVVEPRSELGKALGYLHRQWERLMRFLDDPLLEMTNNEVERDLRTHVLNRKTWYFCGDDASARRMANALTLIVTCRKFGIPPRAYLRDTLSRLLRGDKDLAEMMPDAFASRWRAQRSHDPSHDPEPSPDAATADDLAVLAELVA